MISERRVESPLGRWVRHEWRPGPDDPLGAVVESIAHCDGEAVFPRERILPDARVEIVVHVGEPHRLVSPSGASPLPAACLSGVQAGPLRIEAPPGRARGLGISLRPTGAFAVLGTPLSEVSGRILDLKECIGAAARELADLCEGTGSAVERVRRAARWVADRVARLPAADPSIAWAADRIERRAGALSIAELRARTGHSAARFTAAFREQVGTTPKRYARIVRFHRALSLIHERRAPTLSAAALAAGYYDQAHMNAEFRALGDLTPGEFVAAPRVPDWITVVEPS